MGENFKLSDLEISIKSLEKNFEIIKKEIISTFNQDFLEILKEAVKRKKWYLGGRCYKCGGIVKWSNDKGLWSAVRCTHCGKELYDDAPHSYYYDPLIIKLLKLAEEMSIKI